MFIIVDLESTCRENDKSFLREIIEIGAVKYDSEGKIIDEFNRFIKPKIHPKLSGFCKKLTTITQSDINTAESFPKVISDFKQWIGNDYLLCSWGHYDKHQFINDCKLHNMDYEWANKHISLKHQFGDIHKIKPCGMHKALSICELSATGIHHRGIDDARNIGNIFLKLKDKWQY